MERILFESHGIALEGLLDRATTGQGVVIAHPHPLYGGDMDNSVVDHMARAFRKMGYTTLRVNFRGVGRSQGVYANGIGEQEDIQGAANWLAESGITRVDLAGYSFGAWVIGRLQFLPPRVEALYMVSPPVGMMPLGPSSAMDRVKGIITGELDDIAPPSAIRKLLGEIKSVAELEVVEGADHFFGWHGEDLESRLLSLLGRRRGGS